MPQRRISAVSRPQPIAKTTRPANVIGEVTMSVAMKMAPSMTPPVSIWVRGSAYTYGLYRYAAPVTAKVVPMKNTGISQVMIFFASRMTPPRISAMAEISPSEPPTLPISRSVGFRWATFHAADSFRIPSGVAPVTA